MVQKPYPNVSDTLSMLIIGPNQVGMAGIFPARPQKGRIPL